MNLIATLATDGYKLGHKNMFPEGTTKVFSTWTPRSGKHLPQVKEAVAFGFQGALKEITELFNEQFFSRPKEEVIAEYERQVKAYLFMSEVETKHFEELHDLGYLPIEVKALEEGTLVPFRVPMLTIENTDDKFFWLTNYLETILSTLLWKPATTATIAKAYRDTFNKYALETTGSILGTEFQGHDFSMRGLSGPEDAARSGVGHLLSSVGTDTLPAIAYAEKYYNADVTKELVGCSVAATEHSIMSSYGRENEREAYRRLIEDVHPTGILSIVSDTYNIWDVLTDILPSLKDSIEARDSGVEGAIDKVVIRPDSGDPVDILCGTATGVFRDRKSELSAEQKGVVELLWETFGGTINEQGYKVLNPKVGAIYGDSITLERQEQILRKLAEKGFASTNIVLGIGSYTYQMITRDSLGFAMKATSVTVNGEERAIFKDPVTDDGTKKSAKGRVQVTTNLSASDSSDRLVVFDDNNKRNSHAPDLLKPLFRDGKLLRETSLAEIRARLRNG
jgi:nicotinamide phosphoribosyltransferase